MAALFRQSLHQVLRHPLQIALALVGIGLGVAVVVGIDLASANAARSLEQSTQDMVGSATHQLVGGPEGIAESLYARLRIRNGVHPLAPIIEAQVTVVDHPGVILRWLGVDPIAEAAFARGNASSVDEHAPLWLAPLITEPGTAVISRATARALGVHVGGILHVDHRGTDRALRIVGWIGDADDPNSPRYGDMVITDIATAQEMLDMHGRLSRIDFIAKDTHSAQSLSKLLPADTELVASARRSGALRQMTDAFTTQLQALSLLAVLVGMFLIYNTMTFLVLQRRERLGLLRTLGVTRAEIILLILAEALTLALLGTTLGLFAGLALGSGLTRLVARTISDHYYALTIHGLAISAWLIVKATAVGIVSTLLAALAPAADAARVTPSVAMQRVAAESTIRGLIRVLSVIGAMLITSALLVFAVFDTIAWAFLGLALLVLGCTALTPLGCALLLRLAKRILATGFGWCGEMIAGGLARSASRTTPAITALTLAVATTTGIGLMISSFRHAVDAWLTQLLRADVYVSTTESGQSPQPLPLDLLDALRALPEAETISTIRRVVLESPQGRQQLVVYGLAPKSYAGFHFIAGGGESGWHVFETEDAVLVSEPYAAHHRLAMNQNVSIRTDHGTQPFSIAGIYRDYRSDQGVIAISRRTYNRHFRDRAVTAVGVYRSDGIDADTLIRHVQSLVKTWPQVSVTSRESLHRSSLQIFDRTFTVTQVLRLITGTIAFVGMTGSLIALQLERRYEYGVLRALGVTPRELAGLILGQAGLMGLLAGLLAIPIGLGMAVALIDVINVRAFGWSMDFQANASVLWQDLLLAFVGALFAGSYAAYAASRLRPSESLRQE